MDDPGRGRGASIRSQAESFIDRGARIGRAVLKPLAVSNRIAFVAATVLWVIAFAPWWDTAPPAGFSLVLLAVLLVPAAWLWYHRRRITKALAIAPELIDDTERAYAAAVTRRLDPARRAVRPARAGRRGRLRAGLAAAWFYARNDVRPLLSLHQEALGQLTYVLYSFSPLFFALSLISAAAGLAMALAVPVALLIRLLL